MDRVVTLQRISVLELDNRSVKGFVRTIRVELTDRMLIFGQ